MASFLRILKLLPQMLFLAQALVDAYRKKKRQDALESLKKADTDEERQDAAKAISDSLSTRH